jgi:triacylglycerol lipase
MESPLLAIPIKFQLDEYGKRIYPAFCRTKVNKEGKCMDQIGAAFWGKFIKVAEAMYKPGKTNPAQPSKFPRGWKLAKNINAEAVVSFYNQKEFIGFVAQSVDEPDRFAVVLHGTEGIVDFLDDFEFELIDFYFLSDGGQTEYGFTKFYESFTFVDPIGGESQTLEDYLRELPETASFTVAGYSLGGALATLHTAVLAERRIPVEAYLFASPMVGNASFVKTYNSLVRKSYRIVNQPDIVPKLPGDLLGYEHVNTVFEVNSLQFPQFKHSISSFHSLDVYLYCLAAN